MIKMHYGTACTILEALGCEADPVVYKGKETTVAGMEQMIQEEDRPSPDAHHVHLIFAAGRKARRRRGTLAGMLRDRLMVR